jgi:hypothetical protein
MRWRRTPTPIDSYAISPSKLSPDLISKDVQGETLIKTDFVLVPNSHCNLRATVYPSRRGQPRWVDAPAESILSGAGEKPNLFVSEEKFKEAWKRIDFLLSPPYPDLFRLSQPTPNYFKRRTRRNLPLQLQKTKKNLNKCLIEN